MISDITIGQYYPGNSIIHRIDARMKIILIIILMASVFVCKSFYALGVCAFVTLSIVIMSRISLKSILKGIKPICIIVVITSLLNLFYGSGDPIFELWVFKITQKGIYNAVFMSSRVLLLVLIGLMLTYTTTPNSITDAIEALLKPLHVIFKLDIHSLAMTMTIALRFIPTLIEEVDKIMSAQKSRGADLDSGGLIKRVKAIIPVLIPLFVSSFRRANDLAYAMVCRCYRGGEGRTKMNKMHLVLKDYLALFIVLLYLAGIILIRIFVPVIV